MAGRFDLGCHKTREALERLLGLSITWRLKRANFNHIRMHTCTLTHAGTHTHTLPHIQQGLTQQDPVLSSGEAVWASDKVP